MDILIIKHLPRRHERNLKMPARPLPGHLPCPPAYAEKPHIQLSGTFTEGWLHTVRVGTQCPHSDQITLLILLIMTATIIAPVYPVSTVCQALNRQFLDIISNCHNPLGSYQPSEVTKAQIGLVTCPRLWR